MRRRIRIQFQRFKNKPSQFKNRFPSKDEILSKQESDSNSYQNKIFKKQSTQKMPDNKFNLDFEGRNALGGQSIQINVGRLDSSPGHSKFTSDRAMPSKYGNPQAFLPQISEVSFQNKNQVPNINENSAKISSKLSWSSSSSSSVSSSSDNFNFVKPGPIGIEGRRKSKSFIFDFMTDRQVSMFPPSNTINDKVKSSSNLLQPNLLRPKTEFANTNRLKSRISHEYNKNNPEIYKSYVQQMKSFLNNTPSEVQKLDNKSMKIIKKVLTLENSWFFHWTDFATFWLDYYFRILYPIVFGFYLVFFFVYLTDIKAAYFTILSIEIAIFIGLVAYIAFLHLKNSRS
jgi:hypothetical protein